MCKCYCCNNDLSDKEINFDFEKANGLDLCTSCLDIALEAAYGSDRGLDEGQNIDTSWDDVTDMVIALLEPRDLSRIDVV